MANPRQSPGETDQSSGEDRLNVHFQASMDVATVDGEPFMEVRYGCRTFNQRGVGVTAIAQTMADLIAS